MAKQSRFSISAVVSMVNKVSGPIKAAGRSVIGFSKKMQSHFLGLNKTVDSVNQKINKVGKVAWKGIKTGAAIAAVGIGLFIREASKIENAIAAFTPILGGAENAKKAVSDLNEMAAKTPFQFQQLVKPANTLLGFGAATQKTLIPTLKMLGDLAGGNADKLSGIALAFGQIKAAGQANMQDVNQLINNGVPILAQLAKQWGVTVGEARSMIKVKGTAEEIEKALKAMTSEGGKFFNAMEIASSTFSGKLSTLKDNISLTAGAIGMEMLPFVKEFVDKAISMAGVLRQWVKNNKELINKKITEFFKAFKLVLSGVISTVKLALDVIEFFGPSIKVLIPIIAALVVAIKAWVVVQKIINLVMFANPIGLVVAAIIVLISVVAALRRNWDAVKKSLEQTAWGKKILFIIELVSAALDNLSKKFQAFSKILSGDIAGARKIALSTGFQGQAIEAEAKRRGVSKEQLLNELSGVSKEQDKTGNTNSSTGIKPPSLPGVFASPNSTNINTNRTLTTNGNLNINVRGNENTSVEKQGQLPPNFTLATGVAE